MSAFAALFRRVAEREKTSLLPFFLDGVAANPRLNQGDGIHPNAEGVAMIVESILPKVEELIARAKARRGA